MVVQHRKEQFSHATIEARYSPIWSEPVPERRERLDPSGDAGVLRWRIERVKLWNKW